MKEIKLEVTQKISQNENVKLGSLQHSTTPTLLDSIQKQFPQILKQPSPLESLDVGFFVNCTHHLQEEPLFGIGVGGHFTFSHGTTESEWVVGSDRAAHIHDPISSVLFFQEHFWVFRKGRPVLVYTLEGQQVFCSRALFAGYTNSSHIHTWTNRLYFLTDTSIIA